MSSKFLEDLTRAGRAIWEQYLQPFDNTVPMAPPQFPVWETVPEADLFFRTYRDEFDWRLWMGWALAFSCMATRSAEAEDTERAMETVFIFAELVAVHAGQRCPGNHEATNRDTQEAMREMPEFPGPMWSTSRDMGRFQFEAAAQQEWLYIQDAFVPELKLTDDRKEEVLAISFEIENTLFEDADMYTLLGLMVLSAHLAALSPTVSSSVSSYPLNEAVAQRRVLCVQAHGMCDAVEYYKAEYRLHNALSEFFGNGLN